MAANMNEVQNENNMKKESANVSSDGLAEPKSEVIDQMSGDHQIQIQTDFPNTYVPDYNYQANNQNLAQFEESDGKGFNYGDYYNYYSNYYQHLNVKSDSTENTSQTNSNPRTIDLINKALAKQQLKSTEVRDDDEEEGQIPPSPGIFNRSASRSPPIDSSRNSPYNGSNKSIRRSHSRERSLRSHSRSRKRHTSRSRSRSTSRRRRRSRSRSRSPYFGPIIKDYRRGRRGFVRYPRGFRDRGMRPFRRGGHHSNYNSYGQSRRHEYSRSRSGSFSPKRRQIEVIERIENNSDEEKTMDSKHSEIPKPSDINETEKRLTQSFLAMLEEKQNRAKMIPMTHSNDSADNDPNRTHGFVNTFNNVNIRQMEARKHTLSYDLEREGWQVIDDANTDFKHNQNSKSTENDYYDERRHHSESIASTGPEKAREKAKEMDSDSSGYQNKTKKKKSKKQKKKKKRKASTSSDSDSNSDNDNADEVETKSKKRSKKKKKKSKKRKKKISSSSSTSENEEQIKKHKKKKKRKNSSSESESDDKPEDNVSSVLIPQTSGENVFPETTSSVNNEISENIKIKDKKKTKRKSSDSDSSDSDLDTKKKKKKKRKKSSKKRKHRSSSSSSSDSSDSSDSDDRKKKKKKKSKKSKSKKHKKKSEKKEKSKSIVEDKKQVKEENLDSEFVKVMSVGETPLDLKWPKKLIKYTHCLPSLQYSINPKVTPNSNDFRDVQQITNISHFEDIHRNESVIDTEPLELTTEYERFIGELNPVQQNDAIDGETHSLESKLRDKLVKQFNDRNESQKTDPMTSSERRALEKSKKQSYNSFDTNDGHKRHPNDDLKSAPLSAYYSPKVPKSSPNHKTNDSEVIETKIRGHESDHQNRITINVEHKEESSHRHDLKSSNSKTEDKKITARELLERIKQRKPDTKDSKESVKKESSETKDTKKSRAMPHIGKSKVLSKKSLSKKSVTTATADSTQNAFVSEPMKLDMNYDYNWYYNYYMQSVYGIGQYPQVNDPALASAYYAQYSMVTSYDYNQNDLNNWMTQRGYTFDSNSEANQKLNDVENSEQLNEQNIKTETLEPSVESSASDLIKDDKTNVSIDGTNNKEPNVGQTSGLNSDSNEISHQKNIEVLVSATSHPMMALEESNESKGEPLNGIPSIDSQNNDSDEMLGNSDSVAPPPPRPVMTTVSTTEAITLPNGEVLPAGTKQVVVHPYKTEDQSKFTADWFYNAFNAQNTTTTSQTNS